MMQYTYLLDCSLLLPLWAHYVSLCITNKIRLNNMTPVAGMCIVSPIWSRVQMYRWAQ